MQVLHQMMYSDCQY